MSVKRFLSWPSFNGFKVVLENDARLGATVPLYVPPGMTWTVPPNSQAFAAVPIQVHGTVILDGVLVMR